MKKIFQTLSLAAIAISFGGCSSNSIQSEKTASATPSLEEKIAAEPPANDPNAIAERAGEAFINAKGLTEEQRKKLMTIYRHTYSDAMEIRTEIGKSKSLLFKIISSTAYDSKEVESLRVKIVELDQRRMNLMFKALADVQSVVGFGQGKGDFYKHFYDFEYPKHENLSRNQ